ncbi:MAG: hypothetical protein WCX73_01150 [Candidatus Pacearchaeota archaeon]|jgi:tRNA pseudouridine-54 N-methylase
MREFVYYSGKAKTSGNFGDDLMKAGRMDIICNVIIQTFFISNQMREDIHLHLIFNGPPNPPMHLELISNKDMPISKKDVAGLLKRMLYKCNETKKTEVFPGCFIEKKSFVGLLKELQKEGKKIYILDAKGENLREVKELKNCIFVIGDHEGLPVKELKRFKDKVSIGNKVYFASQIFIILNHEMDIRGI